VDDNTTGGGAYRPASFDSMDDTTSKADTNGQGSEEDAPGEDADAFTHLFGPTALAIKKSPAQLEAEGANALTRAQEKAEQLLAEAQVTAEKIGEEARRQGYEEGMAEAKAKMAENAAKVEQLLSELAAYKPSLLHAARKQVLELSYAIVDCIMGSIAEQHSEQLAIVVERALAILTERESVSVRVNPHEMHHILEAKPNLLAAVDGIKSLTFIDDPSVGRGGCMVETDSTEIDARLKIQLDEIINSLREVSDD
jgi:flagellar assembly protein FliH